MNHTIKINAPPNWQPRELALVRVITLLASKLAHTEESLMRSIMYTKELNNIVLELYRDIHKLPTTTTPHDPATQASQIATSSAAYQAGIDLVRECFPDLEIRMELE